jgi:regulator of protease activity HflC (stomatin/prohibitin superfamily)
VGARGPGLFFIIPIVERMVKTTCASSPWTCPPGRHHRDNVTVKVDAVVYFRVTNPEDAVVKVMDYFRATSWWRRPPTSVLGQSDAMAAQQASRSASGYSRSSAGDGPWGIK